MKELKKILGIGRSFWDSQVLLCAVKLKVFEYLDTPCTAQSLSKKIDVNERALRMLLDTLASLGFLEKRGDNYKNKDRYAKFLKYNTSESLTSILNHYYNMWNDWGNLINSIKTGNPCEIRKNDEEANYHFINGMDNLTKFYKDKVISHIDFYDSKKILDIGSGPATYLREMLKKNKKLKATILDLPHAIAVAKEKLEKEGLINRVEFITGSLEDKKFGSGYDIVLISQVLHSINRQLCNIALKKAYESLKKGGKIYIHEFYLNEKRTFPKDNIVFCLNMLLHTNGGDNFTVSELNKLLKTSGFTIKKIVKLKNPATVLIEGIKN